MRLVGHLVFLTAVLLGVGCVPRPRQDYTISQISRLDSLKELMRINAYHCDPLFSIRYQPTFSAAEYEAMEQAASMVQATSTVVRDRLSKKRPGGFAKLATRLGEQAREVLVGAQHTRVEAVSSALDEMRETCKACHTAYR